MKKRKDGRYQKRVTLPGGKSKLLYGKTQKEVIAKADRLKLDYALGKDLASGNLTLSEWMSTWWGSCKQGKTGYKSQKGYQNAVNRHIVPALGDMPLIAIKPAHVQDLINSMGKAGLAKSTQHKVLITLNSALKYAVINGLLIGNPAQYAELYDVPVKQVNSLTMQELRELLSLAKGTRAELAIHLCVFCGLRRGELVALKWSDIDLPAGMLKVSKAAEFIGNHPREKAPKSRAGLRSIPIPAHLLSMLGSTAKKSIYVVPSARGEQMSATAVRALIRPLQKRLAFSLSYHRLRHTYATLIDMLGVSAKTCQYLLGHAQLSTTKDIYTHVQGEHLQIASQQIGGILRLIGQQS